MTRCAFCGKQVDPSGPGVWRLLSGWEKVRRSGEGVHPIKGRSYSSEYAHDLCLDIHIRTNGQESLRV